MQSQVLQFLEGIPKLVEDHRPEVYLLTFVICGAFSFAMLTLYRRAKTEKWMMYFGIAPAILSVMYLIHLVLWYFGEHYPTSAVRYEDHYLARFLLQILSIANNVWFIAAAREIGNKKPAFPSWCWGLAGGALLATVFGRFVMPQNTWVSEFVARSIDNTFSALSFVLLGYAIYLNVSVRVRRWAAHLALASSYFYAILFITYWFSPMIAHFLPNNGNFTNTMTIIDSSLRAMSLPVKILIFIPAYILLQRFVETLHDLTKLQDKVLECAAGLPVF